jgi:DNA-binding transcriptional ArsR family regulator
LKEEEVVGILKALSSPSRLEILKLLGDNRKLCVNAITGRLEISQPAVSQHLSILKKAGLVTSDRYGSIIHYTLNRKRIDEFKQSVADML